MSLIKYSIGGPIISIKDADCIENKEETPAVIYDKQMNIVVCKKCGLQHMLLNNKDSVCCGEKLKINNS